LSDFWCIELIPVRKENCATTARPAGLLDMETPMRKVWTLGAALASLVVLSGCSAIDSIASGNVIGTYELRSINGTQPPALIYQEPGYSEEILSATFSLENDGSYSEAGIIRETINGRSTTSSTSSYGYYDEYNGDITFTEQGGRT
jgi:hypothetical protein